MKRTRRRQKTTRLWKDRSIGLTLLAGVILALLLLSPMLLAGFAPQKACGQEAGESVQGDGEHYLGLKPTSPEEAAAYTRIEMPKSLTYGLSTAVDLSSQLPPVGDQGQQSSCTAWAASYYYKSWSEKQEHPEWDLENPFYQFSPSFIYNQINGGVDGGSSLHNAFNLMQEEGDVDIAEMPYSVADFTTQPTASQLEAAKPYRISDEWGYFWVRGGEGPYTPENDIAPIKAWLDSGKILVMGIPIYTDFPDYLFSGPMQYYNLTPFSIRLGWHAITIVGYDNNINPSGSDADLRGGFKMVNSWGTDWNGANEGYLYLSYDFVKKYAREAWSMNDLSPDTPVITSLSATSGRVWDTITIYGNNFGTLRRNAKVTFNGVAATSLGFTNESIIVQVPTGATTGPVKVYNWDGDVSNAVDFAVEGIGPGPVQVTSITPDSAAQFGMNIPIIDLSGSGFVVGATVRLETPLTTIYATNVEVASPNTITCDFFFFGQEPGIFDVIVTNPDGSEGRLEDAFTVNGLCGQGAGASLLFFGITIGLLGLVETGSLLRRRKRKRG